MKGSNVKKVILCALTAAVLSGCSSMMNIGESKLSGPVPQGFECADTIDALAITDNYQDGDAPDASLCKGRGKKRTADSALKAALRGGGNGVSPFGNEAVPNMRVADEPKPILMPAQVMRVWVNAYEAPDGSLVYPGRTFTEVTPRRWNVGYSAGQGINSNRTISPLTVKRGLAAAEEEAEQKEGDAEQAAAETASQAAPESETDLNLNRVQQRAVDGAVAAAGPGAEQQQQGSVANPLPPLR